MAEAQNQVCERLRPHVVVDTLGHRCHALWAVRLHEPCSMSSCSPLTRLPTPLKRAQMEPGSGFLHAHLRTWQRAANKRLTTSPLRGTRLFLLGALGVNDRSSHTSEAPVGSNSRFQPVLAVTILALIVGGVLCLGWLGIVLHWIFNQVLA